MDTASDTTFEATTDTTFDTTTDTTFDATSDTTFDATFDAIAYLNDPAWFSSRYGLDRMRDLMARLGNPQDRLRFVHVAGTNGKGSTLEYISRALILAGYRTGQFTSPYITRYEDRIRINGQDIGEDALCRITERVRAAVGDEPYSQFEITMAIAMLWFEEEKCDIVVLETGIGGLLDSTNVIPPPLLSVITSVSLDHTAILGDTVEKIAVQKAGIIGGGGGKTVLVVCIVEHKNLTIVKRR